MGALPAAHRARSGGCSPRACWATSSRCTPTTRSGSRRTGVPAVRAQARRRRAARPRHLPGVVRVDGARHAEPRSWRSPTRRSPASTPRPRSCSATRAAPTRCSTARCAAAGTTRAAIVGTEGRIEIDGAVLPADLVHADPARAASRSACSRPARRGRPAPRGRRGRALPRGGALESPEMPLDETVAIMRTMDADQSFRLCLTTLPIALRGSSSRKRTSRGRLCGASSPATWSISVLLVRRVVLGHDPGDDLLAEVGVLLAGDRGLLDAGVLEQRDLDLAGADLVAAGLDQVGRAAADDAPVAVLADGGEVAGEEPAVAHRLVGGVGAVEVAGEQVRAADGRPRRSSRRRCRRSRCRRRRRAAPRRRARGRRRSPARAGSRRARRCSSASR